MGALLNSLSARVLLGLILGLVVGAAAQAAGGPAITRAIGYVEPLGGLWLNALRMTVVPLIFALLVTGVAAMAGAAAGGRLTARAVVLFLGVMLAAAIFSVAFCTALLAVWPVAPEQARAFVAALGPVPEGLGQPLDVAAWIQGLAPANALRAAADDQILPWVVFACFFGFALTRIRPDLRASLVSGLQALGDTMIVIVRWVLLLAPIGVFALALGVGFRTGFDAAGVIGHYIVVVCAVQIVATLLVYPLVVAFGRVSLLRFVRAAAPVQALAISTQSSIACLPLMVERAESELEVAPPAAGLLLPLAVAVFRMTSTTANLAVVVFVAHLYGLEPSLLALGAAVFVALLVGVGSVGLPGQVSFFASIGPISLAMGVPVAALPIFLAVEVVPDIFRTIGNVTADLAATRVLGRNAVVEPTVRVAPSSAAP